jgi:hypothetical protein
MPLIVPLDIHFKAKFDHWIGLGKGSPDCSVKYLTLIIILFTFITTIVIVAFTIIPPVFGSVQIDKFGISELYPSATNGTEWYSAWDNGITRTIGSGQRDPYDNSFEVTGNGEVTIDEEEEGIATITGGAPRMRVPDINFENVEITFYAKRISEEEEISYQGFVAGARSKHYTNDLCGANTYYGRFTYDGRVSFEKELFHGHGNDAQYPPIDAPSKYIWAEDEGIPDDEWVGFKFIVRTLPNEDGVLLELYRDLTDGSNGGEWEKVLQHNDTGEWYVEADDGICDNYPHNKILLTPGFVFIRNDFIDQAQYKKFSIREIANI